MSARPVALITGASAGLGVDYARQLMARGRDLVLVARREDRMRALAAELEKDGARVRVLACDLARHDAARLVYAFTQAEGVAVDVLINNAGFGFFGDFHQEPLEEALRMVDLHCRTTVALTHAYLPGMLERRRGTVLNVASTAAFQAIPYFSLYAATKAFLLSLTEALSVEYASAGIHFEVVCPGPTATEFGDVAGIPTIVDRALYEASDLVVRRSLDAMDRRQVILVSGLMNWLGAVSARFAPRAWLRAGIGLAARRIRDRVVAGRTAPGGPR